MKRILRVVTLLTLLSSVAMYGFANGVITVLQAVAVIQCNGGNNGSININPMGGTAPYTYLWSNGSTTQNLNSLAGGTYTVTITDNTGTTSSFSFTITEPSAITITKSVTNENCGGQNIGAINLTVGGGTGSYSFNWSNGATTQNLANLTAAVYYVTVTDGNGCAVVDSANVTQPPGVGITMAVTNVTCSGGMNDGAIGVTVQFGNPAYQYLWNDGIITQNRASLTTGNYTLTVTDAIGCTATATTAVTQLPGSMSINTLDVNPTCFGGTNGAIDITSVVGSTAPYTYLWSTTATTQNLTGVGAGIYSVTATSSTGCSASASATLTQPAQINLTLHTFPLTCFDSNNGAITTTVSSGTWPYTYSWSNGSNATSITSLPSGNYSLTVTDNKGCTVVAGAALVTQPLVVSATATTSQLACSGGPTGSVITSVSGGTAPYSYWWGAGVTSANRNNVMAGSYTVTVTDAHGCTATTTGTVAPYTPMTLWSSQTNIVCYTSSDGTLNMNVNNGLAPYSYLWSNGDTVADISSLAGGPYMITVTDAHNCTVSATRTINSPPFPITVNSTAVNVSCYGLSDGSLSLNPINGAPPYNFKWGNGATTSGISNLAIGSYVVTITDSFGCRVPDVFTITQPTLITPVAVPGNVSCFGGNNGSINLSVTGGYSPFSYAWNDAVDSQTRASLHAGGYTVTITDNHGCTALSGATVSQPTQLALSMAAANPLCNGASNGWVTVTASGGTPGYSYNWGGGVLTPGQTNLPPGPYTVTVTDNNGCTGLSFAMLTAPVAINISSATTSVACNGGNNGTINLTVTGATAPYTFDWGGGITSQNRSNLVSGNYTVTVTDHAGCTATYTSIIAQSTTLTLATVIANATCFGMNNGSITVTPSGGTAPYNYTWVGGPNFVQKTNLAAGSYPLTVTDHVGCQVAITPVVNQPAMLSVSSNATSTTCNGSSDGAIHITVSGGTGSYTYNWGGGIISQNRANLSSGSYTVTATDSLGCSVANTSTVNQPAPLTITSPQTNVLCNGGSTGSIQLTITGGTSPYNFNWGGGINTQNRTALAQGTYNVTVTDANLCLATKSILITQPNTLAISTTPTNVACFGQPSGAVATTVTGGTGPFTYSWSNGNATQNLVGLTPGNFAVTVNDANACSASASSGVTQPAQIVTSVFSVVAPNCFGASNAVVTIQIAGGTPAYVYSWSNGATTQNLNGVGIGTYTVTAADAHGCTASTLINVTQPSLITLTNTVTNATCYNSNTGAITTVIGGGNGGFSYNWSNAATTANLTNIVAGNYTVTVHDAGNCSASFGMQVNQPSQIVLTSTQTNVSCNGGNTGSAGVTATGGSGTYTYGWSNGQTTSQISQLALGNFVVTVTDASLCSVSTSVNISQINSLVLNLTTVNVSCAGQANGSVSSTISGGAGGYQYNWSTGATSANITSLTVGNYVLTVTDVNQCSTSAQSTITQNNAITTTPTITNVSCFGSSTGSIQMASSGGTGNYQYNWSDGASSQNLVGIIAGSYSVTVRDANACSVTTSMAVTQPVQLNINLNATNVNCNGSNTGSVASVVTGGTGTYAYNWSNANTTSNVSNLQAGSYILTVKDALGCSLTSSINIMQPSAITIQPSAANVQCNGSNTGAINLQVTGGTGAYSFIWSNQATTQQIAQLFAGNYAVTVQDANSCSAISSATINQPSLVNVTTTQSNYACAIRPGMINVSVNGGTSPYTYLWQDGNTQQNRNNLTAGTYSVSVSDQNHCIQFASVNIGQIPAMVPTITLTDVSCFGGDNGNMTVSLTGGSQPFSYNWSNAGTTNTIQQLTASPYSVVVTDAYGCTVATTATVAQPPVIQLASTNTPVTCYGLNDGSAHVTASGGTLGFSYQWSNNNTTQSISNVSAGSYVVSVVDGNNCTAVFNNVVITQPALMSIASTVVSLGCMAQNDGSIKVAAGGGTPPYQYNWSTGAKAVVIDSLAAGTYGVTINDVNNCAISENFTVATSTPLSIIQTVQNASCKGVDNGSVSVNVTGGALPYNYNWNNGQQTPTASALGDGNYVVTVTDANGCSIQSGGDVTSGYELSVHASASVTITSGTPVQLGVTANTDHQNMYSWTPASVLTCSNCANTEAHPLQTTLFTVNAVDANGCKASDTVTVQVNSSTDIFIPNAFTPNGDGVNDLFKIFGDLGNVYFMDVAIFDRWGEKVFESNNPNFEWDGIYKGEPAPQGVYIYTATMAFGNGTHKDYKGSVTLIR